MPDQVERVILQGDPTPYNRAVDEANRKTTQFEKGVEGANRRASDSFRGFKAGVDGARGSVERLLNTLERRAAMSTGKTPLEKLRIEQEMFVKRLAGDQPAIDRANRAFDTMAKNLEPIKTGFQQARTAVTQFVGAYLSIGALTHVLKAAAVDTALYAARTQTLRIVTDQLAKVNNLGTQEIRGQIEAVKALGITTQEAHSTLQRMMFAELDVAKASKLARVAQDAAVIAGVNSSEALEKMILGITTGQTRLLHTMGLQVSLEEVITEGNRKLGREMTEVEKRAAMLNKVLEEGEKIYGTYEAAMETAGKKMTSLKRYFDEAKNSIGNEFQPALEKVIDTLAELAKFIGAHPELGATLALAASGGLAAISTRLILGAGAGALVGKAAGIGALAYGAGRLAWWGGQRLGEMTGGESLATQDSVRRMAGTLAASRAQMMEDFRKFTVTSTEEEAKRIRTGVFERGVAATDKSLAMEAELSKAKQAMEAARAAQDLAGFRSAFARVQAIEKEKAQMEDLKKKLQDYIELVGKFPEALEKGNQRVIESMARATDRMFEGAVVLQSRLGTPGDIAAGELARAQLSGRLSRQVYGLATRPDLVPGMGALGTWQERQLSASGREARMQEQLIRLRTGPGNERAAIEETYALRVQYAQKEFEIHQDRYQLEADLREAEIDRITEAAELERRRYDDLRHSIEGLFDAMITRSQSLGKALLDMFQVAVLAPIKQAFASMLAGAIYGRGGATSGAGALGGLGGMFGLGGAPAIASTGSGALANVAGVVGGPGGTSGFAGPVGGRGGWGGMLGGFGGMGGGWRDFLGIGGSVQTGAGTATTWGAASMGQKLGSIAASDAALMGGIGLGVAGFMRGGWSGAAMMAGSGALIGYRVGGPIGAAIGAGVGFLAGVGRMLFGGKPADQKAREKIKALYQVDISDKGVLKQIVDTAKQGFGGNIDLAVRSPQVRELVELYAEMTGQRMPLASKVRPVSLVETGGQVFQRAQMIAGRSYAFESSLPTIGGTSFDRIPAGVPSSAGPTVVNLQMDSRTIGQVVLDNGRVVAQSVTRGVKASMGRFDLTAAQMSPGLVRG